MADLLKHYPHYSNFGAVAPDGTVFCSAIGHAGKIHVGDKAFFRRAMETRTLAVGDYEHDPLLGKSSLSFGYPVTDSTGSVTAIVFAGLELGWFHRWVADTPLPHGSMLTITDRNGTVMVVVPGPATWVGRPLSEAPRIKAILDKKSGMGEAPGPNGAPSFFAFAPLHAASKQVEAYVGIGIPRGAALAEVKQVTGSNSVLALVGILALIAGWFGSDVFVVRRMKALVHATRRVTAGDLRVRTGLPYERTSWSARACLDEMASSLERRYDQSQRSRTLPARSTAGSCLTPCSSRSARRH